ncbi:mitochondrial ribosomal protein L1 [Rhynchophorus ferrugineus]|uniref:mitochondrial ribosomal protein L1 n=1 Tax=Rhynchophorus ferrugineus TaxID=354439 RepID=UPI003FCE39F4
MSLLSNKLFQLNQLIAPQKLLTRIVPVVNTLQERNYAARKGTRERKKKAKVKVEIKKVGFIAHNLRGREQMLAARASKKFSDTWKADPIDNVYPMKYYKWIVYPFSEAIKAHRETHHPEIYNKPDAELYATVELNMQAEKKNRFIENFTRIAAVPHKFDHGEDRNILVFAKSEESQNEAREAGAQYVGGPELVKQIQTGQLSLYDFQYFIAHPDILPELVQLRGVMKRRFPNVKSGTLETDLKSVIDRYLRGISYQAVKDEYEKDFGQINAVLGHLNMNDTHLEENFAAFINDVYTQKPKRDGSFIYRCYLWSPPSSEKLKIDHEMYLDAAEEPKEEKQKIVQTVVL